VDIFSGYQSVENMTVGEPFWNCTGDYLYIIFRLAVVPGCISELCKLRMLACLYVLLYNSWTPPKVMEQKLLYIFQTTTGGSVYVYGHLA